MIFFEVNFQITYSATYQQIHDIADKQNCKISPERSFLMFVALKCFGHENGFKTNQPMQSKILLEKDDWHSILSKFDDHQFSIHAMGEGENVFVNPSISFFERCKSFSETRQNVSHNNSRKLQQQPVSLNDTDITDKDDPFGKRGFQDNDSFHPDSSLKIKMMIKDSHHFFQ